MARGSIGRERMISSVGNLSHQPPNALQEDLNNELLAVSFLFIFSFINDLKLVFLDHQKL